MGGAGSFLRFERFDEEVWLLAAVWVEATEVVLRWPEEEGTGMSLCGSSFGRFERGAGVR